MTKAALDAKIKHPSLMNCINQAESLSCLGTTTQETVSLPLKHINSIEPGDEVRAVFEH